MRTGYWGSPWRVGDWWMGGAPGGLSKEHGHGCGDGMLYGGSEGGVVVRAVRGDDMPQQKRGLGRGLGALIPTAPGPAGLDSHASEPAGAPMAGSVAGVREQQTDG